MGRRLHQDLVNGDNLIDLDKLSPGGNSPKAEAPQSNMEQPIVKLVKLDFAKRHTDGDKCNEHLLRDVIIKMHSS